MNREDIMGARSLLRSWRRRTPMLGAGSRDSGTQVEGAMGNDRRRILEMLENGKITAAEAERLLQALEPSFIEGTCEEIPPRKNKRFLHISVDGKEKVNIRVPMGLIGAGMKLSTIIPAKAKEKLSEELGKQGIPIDLENLTPKMMDDLIESLSDLDLNVDNGGENKVRIYCE